MRSLVGATAVGCILAAAEAQGPYKWSPDHQARNWHPARATQDVSYMAILGAMGPAAPALAPAPTAAPRVDERKFRKRTNTDNTCAYISGEPDQSLYCSSDSACVFNSARSYIGCCPDSSITCPIWTTCYESSESDSVTTDNGFTLWCGDSSYPKCVKHVYADDVFFGYTLLGCGKTASSDVVYYSATESSESDTTTTTSSSSSRSTGPVTTTQPPSPGPTTTAAASSSPPVGAIVGGVVGGVGALGLIGFGAFLLLRKRGGAKSPPPPHPAAAAAPAGHTFPPQSPYGAAGPGPQMAMAPPQQQQHPPQFYSPGGFVPVADPRASIAKPAYGVGVYSEPTSPSPSYSAYNAPPTQQMQQTPSPPAAGGGYYAQGMGHQSGPVPGYAAELGTGRGDEELRELA